MTAPRFSQRLYLTLDPRQVGLFRFLLEAHDNLAYFTVLDKRRALLALIFAPGQRRAVDAALAAIGQAVPLAVIEPLAPTCAAALAEV